MANPRLKPAQKRLALNAIEHEAYELAALGYSQGEIGEQIGRTPSGVSRMLARIEKKLAGVFRDRAEAIKTRQTMYLQSIYRQAMTSYRNSQRNAKSTKTVVSTDDQGGNKLETTVREAPPGDPRFLDQAMRSLADVRKIWGVDEVTTRHRDAGPVSIQVAFVDGREVFGHTHKASSTPTIDASIVSATPAEDPTLETNLVTDIQPEISEPTTEVK